MWVRRLGSTLEVFRHQTIPMRPHTRSNRRVIISTSFTRVCAISDWPNDIYTLRGPPVARDRGSAQWQVFCCGPWKRVIRSSISACRTLYMMRYCVWSWCWRRRVCMSGLYSLKDPPQGLKWGPASPTNLVSFHYPNTPSGASVDASGLSPCFHGRVGSPSKLRKTMRVGGWEKRVN